MDPISQIFAQRDGGSAQGAGFGSFYAEGQRLNLSRRHLDLQNRQENRLQTQQNALLKYQEEILKGQAADVGIQAKINQMKLDLTNVSNAFQLELGKLDRLLMEKGARDPEVQQLYGQMIEQNPKAFMVGLGLDIRNSIRGATMLRKELLDSVSIMQEIETKFGRPISNFNPKTGTIGFEDKPSGTIIRTKPDGSTEIIQGATMGEMTTANKTDMQKRLMAARQTVATMNSLERNILANPDAFGLQGIGKEAVEIGLGQIDPKADSRVSDARHKAGLAFVEIADSLRTDSGNMSLYEQQRLKELGDTRSWKDHPSRALAKARGIRTLAIARELRILKDLREAGETVAAPDDALLLQVPGPELIPMFQSGLLTVDDIKRARAIRNRANTE